MLDLLRIALDPTCDPEDARVSFIESLAVDLQLASAEFSGLCQLLLWVPSREAISGTKRRRVEVTRKRVPRKSTSADKRHCYQHGWFLYTKRGHSLSHSVRRRKGSNFTFYNSVRYTVSYTVNVVYDFQDAAYTVDVTTNAH